MYATHVLDRYLRTHYQKNSCEAHECDHDDAAVRLNPDHAVDEASNKAAYICDIIFDKRRWVDLCCTGGF